MVDSSSDANEEEGLLSVPAAAAACQLILRKRCMSATLKPKRVRNSGLSERVGKAKASEAVDAAVDDFSGRVFPMWLALQMLSVAIATRELGKGKQGAHIQYGSVELVPEDELVAETARKLKARLKRELKPHNAGDTIDRVDGS